MSISYNRSLELREMFKPIRTKVEAVDKKYSLDYCEPEMDMPESLDLVKLSYEVKSEAELRALAVNRIEATYIRRRQQLDASHGKALQSINEAYTDIDENLRRTSAKLLADYVVNYNSAYRRLVNNGLMFSSVMQRASSDALSEYNKNVSEANADSDSLRAKIDADKDAENASYEAACSALNSERQAAEQKAYDAIVESEYNKRLAIEKYNAQLDEKEKKYLMSRAKALESARQAENNRAYAAIKLYAQVGETGYKENIILEKYNILQKFFGDLKREEAQFLMDCDSFVRMHLGSYFSALTEWVQRTLPD
ncbi:MAG: hypothetical protein NC099_04360 [Corallococcus sp.]|nr:hypothetical protein [Corallococcus sp.]